MKKALIIAVLSASIVARGDAWMTDYEAAMKKARDENKVVLANFTGSDWCCWCKKLESEVFGKDNFVWQATNRFVLLKIDFPRDRSGMSDSLIAQNNRLAHEYDINGFPTVLAIDANGDVLAETGYVKGGAERYLIRLYWRLGYDATDVRMAFLNRRKEMASQRDPEER